MEPIDVKSEVFKKQVEEIAEKSRREYFKELNIDPEFYDVDMSDFKAETAAQKGAKEAVENMIKTKRGKIVLIGSNGTGKSMLANIAAKELGGKVYTMYEISAMVRQSYTIKGKSELEIIDELAELPFLAVDEVGRVAPSEAMLNWFSYLLSKRHSRFLPYMLIGNIHFRSACPIGGCPKCFENYFDKDILSRLKQDTSIFEIIAPDKRSQTNTFHFVSDRKKEA